MARLYSGANNFVNLSHDPILHSLCGFTESEVKSLLGKSKSTEELRVLKEYYSGYCFILDQKYSATPRLFNPYAINRSINNILAPEPFWSAINSESLLKNLPDITKLIPLLPLPVSLSVLKANVDYQTYSINNVESIAKLLFENGYLSVVDFVDDKTAILDFPNEEVRSTVRSDFKEYFLSKNTESMAKLETLKQVLDDGDLLQFFKFANEVRLITPFNLHSLYDSEASWHQLVVQILFFAEIEFISEQPNALGRSDVLLLTKNGSFFIIEFKLYKDRIYDENMPAHEGPNKSSDSVKTTSKASRIEKLRNDVSQLADAALEQIVDKKYMVSSFYNNNRGKIKSIKYVAAIAVNSDSSTRDATHIRQFYYILQRTDGCPDIFSFLD
jgi:hypothetical protein